jgi:crotonobetainyl-CoA:carnitine CoA-transferase CaiB-like acyl-CoA transferase
MSFAPEPAAAGAGPDHGAHTDEVLRELGYDRQGLDRLRSAGALG